MACSAGKSAVLVSGIEAMGGHAVYVPVIEILDVENKKPMDRAIHSLKEYAWILFSSAYGVKFFVRRLQQLRIPISSGSMPRICAIGPATAREIEQSGYTVDLMPECYVAEGVLEALRKFHGGMQALAGCRILLPRAKEAREVLPEALSAAGAVVDIVPCYRTIRGEPDPAIIDQIKSALPDMLVFTSPSAVRSFVEILGKNDGIDILLRSAVAVIGPITAATAESFGKSPDIMPEKNTIASLLASIRHYFCSR